MTKNELSLAMKIAQDKNFRYIDNNGHHLIDITIFDGYGLESFKPATCTLVQIAALLRWQCFQFNGNVDGTELDNLSKIGRKKFIVIGN